MCVCVVLCCVVVLCNRRVCRPSDGSSLKQEGKAARVEAIYGQVLCKCACEHLSVYLLSGKRALHVHTHTRAHSATACACRSERLSQCESSGSNARVLPPTDEPQFNMHSSFSSRLINSTCSPHLPIPKLISNNLEYSLLS